MVKVRTVRVAWNGRSVAAAAPEAIAHASVEISVAAARLTERAAGAVLAIDDRAARGIDVVSRLMLRAEGLASSAIEGLRADAADVALAEMAGVRDVDAHSQTAAWVADNLAVVSDALSHRGALTQRVLLRWHTRLMRHAPGIDAKHVGAWRDELGWVGGSNPLVATFVAAPADRIDAAMKDLLQFVARTDVDAVTQAAVAHAQFETIHPFADGNGRIGRVLIAWILRRRLDARPPPVSLQFARDIGGYQAGLTLYRQGDLDAWVRWFADAVERAAERAGAVMDAVEELQARWREATSTLRADAAAHRVLDLLADHPVISAATAAGLLDVSNQAALNALDELAERGVLTEARPAPAGRGRPRRWWVARDLLDLIGR